VYGGLTFEKFDRFSRNLVLGLCLWKPPQYRNFLFPAFANNNMEDTQICEAVMTLLTFTEFG